ncbi:hypothetical protein D3C85_806940 [compost metagenome]
MKKHIFIIAIIIALSCNHSQKADKTQNKKVVKKELRPFFDSDKVDHYYLDFSEDDFTKILMKDNNTKKEEEFFEIYVHHFPDSIPKENFEKILLKHNYKKSGLTIKQQKDIQNVFSEKDSSPDSYASCAAEYRDIFIFKKKGKTVGIAKICFKCSRTQIVGSKLDVNGFGLWSELNRLKSIIRPNERP